MTFQINPRASDDPEAWEPMGAEPPALSGSLPKSTFAVGMEKVNQWKGRASKMFRIAGLRLVNAELEDGFLEDVEAGEQGGEGVVLLLEARTSSVNSSVLVWQLLLTRAWLPVTMVKLVFLVYCLIVALVVSMLQLFFPVSEETGQRELLSLAAVTLLGSAVFLLMGYRLNASYDRWWEGRKRWGMVVNRTRDLARQALAWIAPRDWDLAEEIVRWTVAFAVVTKHHLRYEDDTRELKGVLDEEDRLELQASNHQPIFTMERLSNFLAAAHGREILTDIQAMRLDENLTQFEDEVGACERILRTSLPFAYVIHTRTLMLVWLVALPFAAIPLLGWATIPVCIVISYGMLVLEDTGTDVEEPFGHSFNALPVDVIVRTIQNNLLEMLERQRPAGSDATPAALKARDSLMFERAVHQDEVTRVRLRRNSMAIPDSNGGPISDEAKERRKVWKASAEHIGHVKLIRSESFHRQRTRKTADGIAARHSEDRGQVVAFQRSFSLGGGDSSLPWPDNPTPAPRALRFAPDVIPE